jgi:hypothetical protein
MNEEWGRLTRVHPAVVDLWYLSERAKKLGINHFDRLGRKDACAAPPKSQRIAQMLNTAYGQPTPGAAGTRKISRSPSVVAHREQAIERWCDAGAWA